MLQLLLRPTVLVRRSRCVVLCVKVLTKREKKLTEKSKCDGFHENLDVVRVRALNFSCAHTFNFVLPSVTRKQIQFCGVIV